MSVRRRPMQNLVRFWSNRWNITLYIFIYLYIPYFFNSPTGQTPERILTRVVLLGFKMLKLTTNPFSCAKGQILAKNGLWNFLTKISKLCRPSNVPSCKPMIELLLSDSSFNLVSFVRHLCGTSVRLFPCRRSSLRFSSWQTDVGTR